MFRVTKAEEESATVLTVDGQLSGDSVAVVETCCEQAMTSGKPVDLFLRDVSTVDPAGYALLSRLAARGVRLHARGVYTSYLVRMLKQGSGEPERAAGPESAREPLGESSCSRC
jgi:ABC-type transporter Mla MlaB component